MILRFNSRGERVRELQTLLKSQGYLPIPKVTNFFGSATEGAVKEFQQDNNLTVDGVVGPQTWKLLISSTKNTITPIYQNPTDIENFSDPEEEMIIESVKESQPLCPRISELINLITSSKITRNITKAVFHCTATSQKATVEGIIKYWKNNLGWKNPGYHIIVRPDGSWSQLLDFNKISNGVGGINSTSIHISYIGGIDSKGNSFNNLTKEQSEVFETFYTFFKQKLPHLTFHGHYEFSNKACPSFDVQKWISNLDTL
jgi:N-acetylmuramoyl-L-alanine amidase